jgi:hypothetical protein
MILRNDSAESFKDFSETDRPARPCFGLTIQQPWIDLILRGTKTMEVRVWDITERASKSFHEEQGKDRAPGWHISELGPVLLHAGLRIDWRAAALFGYAEPWKLARGMIIGQAEFIGVAKLDRDAWYRSVDQHLVMHPPRRRLWGGSLDKVRILPRPLRFGGKQYFFPVRGAIVHEIERQMQTIES